MLGTTSIRGCSKVLTLVTSMLLLAPSSIGWYWGAISVYGISFAISRLEAGPEVQKMWVISLYYSFRTLIMIANGFMFKYTKRGWVILAASFLICAAMFSSYFMVQESWIGLEFMISLMVGLGDGAIYGNVIHLVVDTSKNDVGLLTSILQSSYSIGGFVVTQLITWHVNPSNKSPNMQYGNTKYFAQSDIVDKVPSSFLTLGGLTLGMHVTAFLIMLVNLQLSHCLENHGGFEEENIIVVETHDYNSDKNAQDNDTQEKLPARSDHRKENTYVLNELTTGEMLKTKTFYALWVSAFCSEFPFLVLLNYYKLYGQVWIHSDHFLSSLGSSLTFITLISRILWGIGVDKLGPRRAALIMMSTSTITVTWYFFTPMLGRWAYFVATLIYASSTGTIYSFYLGATGLIFGRRHIVTNYGMLTSASVIFNSMFPFVIDALMVNFGWFATFAVAGGVNVISLICCLVFIPSNNG